MTDLTSKRVGLEPFQELTTVITVDVVLDQPGTLNVKTLNPHAPRIVGLESAHVVRRLWRTGATQTCGARELVAVVLRR